MRGHLMQLSRAQMDFLQNTVKLSVYDVVRFPAYFSYPLEKVIEPRVVFLEVRERPRARMIQSLAYLTPLPFPLQQRDRPLAMWGLSTVLTVSDADFATRLAGVEPEFYLRFRKA